MQPKVWTKDKILLAQIKALWALQFSREDASQINLRALGMSAGLEVKFYDSMGTNINLPEIWGTSASISFNDEKLDFGENE